MISENELALRRTLDDILIEYDRKVESAEQAVKEFEDASTAIKSAATIQGTWGNVNIDTGRVYVEEIKSSLCRSAWRHLYVAYNLERLFTAKDKRRFDHDMENPPEFTRDNVIATYGEYIKDPMGNIIRGLAEVFVELDQSYKSHEKVKIGVAGLPKRVILSGFGDFSNYGQDRVRDIVNALAAYQGKPLINYGELYRLIGEAKKNGETRMVDIVGDEELDRGMTLKLFKNGNGHLHFDKQELLDINRALAEFYGDVLADAHQEKPTERKQSTEVAKDLQYYPTPQAVVTYVMRDVSVKGQKVLEPSCGCGRFMDAIREEGGDVFGIEFDKGRAGQARAKGHNVLIANFLEVEPQPIYDVVIMNPPFYGKHYAKHVEHAMKFLKDGGRLVSILPITARTDHGLLEGGKWWDLPVGSFSESGTNINTTVYKKWK